MTYPCRDCEETFSSVHQLGQHRLNSHPRQQNGNRRKHHSSPTPSTSSGGGASHTAHTNKKIKVSHLYSEDPPQPEVNMLPPGDDDLSTAMRHTYEQHWFSIRTHHRTGQRVQDVYNYRIVDVNIHSLVDQLQQMFRNQSFQFKVNVSFGFILQTVETGQLRYFHSSHNQGRPLEAPHLIRNQADFDAFLEAILQEDILEWA